MRKSDLCHAAVAVVVVVVGENAREAVWRNRTRTKPDGAAEGEPEVDREAPGNGRETPADDIGYRCASCCWENGWELDASAAVAAAETGGNCDAAAGVAADDDVDEDGAVAVVVVDGGGGGDDLLAWW